MFWTVLDICIFRKGAIKSPTAQTRVRSSETSAFTKFIPEKNLDIILTKISTAIDGKYC